MKSVEEYVASYRDAVQAQVPDEQVLAVGLVSNVGATKSAFVGLASPLVAMFTRRSGRRLAPGFPMNAMVALTPTRIICFAYRPRGTSLKPTKRIVEWPAAQVRTSIVPATTERGLDHVVFELADGQRYELELTGGIGRYRGLNDPFRALVGQREAQPVAR